MSSAEENIKKERSVARRIFTRHANELVAKLNEEDIQVDSELTSLFLRQKEQSSYLQELDAKFKELVLKTITEDDLEKEIEDALKYKTKWFQLKAKYDEVVAKSEKPKVATSSNKTFTLPKLQLQSFDGQLRNWLNFWGQFIKVHEDVQLDDIDKYQYLVHSMQSSTEVKTLVEGFPPTAYKECVEQLKARYAREDLLIQVYVRELLNLVLFRTAYQNVTQLYDLLNAQLRALETLGVTKDKYAAFLLPMIESSLPEDTTKAWERCKGIYKDVSEEMAKLLLFLKKEVESEQRMEMAKKTFRSDNTFIDPNAVTKMRTAECLYTNNKPKEQKIATCVWCDKETHPSIECYKIYKMDIERRKQYLSKKKICTICLIKGHHAKVCRSGAKCLFSQKRHSVILCERQEIEKSGETVQKKASTSSTLSASMNARSDILLQTMLVKIPTEVKSKLEHEMKTKVKFKENIKRTDSNRYEVKLPFEVNYVDLLPNYNKAKLRLESLMKNLFHLRKFQDYDSVFKMWLDLGIIGKTDIEQNKTNITNFFGIQRNTAD